MNQFSIKQDTPRLVVEFRRSVNGGEQFGWGVVGQLPILTLIGYIARVQSELMFRTPDKCDQSALVIVWVDEKFDYCVNSNIPVDSLNGMLESIKTTMVHTQMEQARRQSESEIVGPNGQPIHAPRFR